MAGEPLVVLYDGDCRWCRWSVARLVRLDRERQLRLMAIQDPRAAGLLAPVPEGQWLESAHAVSPEGTVFSGGDAAAPIAARLPAVAWSAPLLRSAPGPVRWAYGLIAGNRSLLGRGLDDAALRRADALIAQRSS